MKTLSPAKINLFLEVTSKRTDGYHELFTLMCPVALYDELDIHIGDGPISVSCDHPHVPENESNLAFRAAEIFFHTVGIKQGASIHITKRIPVAAGLGGGSSNAACVLTTLNGYFENPLKKERLLEIGLSLGADVPFFIDGCPAFATGIGEVLEPFENLKSYHAVILCPDIRISTAEVYRNLNLRLTKCKKQLKNLRFSKYAFDAAHHLCNDLESYTAERFQVIGAAKEVLMGCGAVGSLMSGSGPSVFGLFEDEKSAEKAYARLEQNDMWDVFSAPLII